MTEPPRDAGAKVSSPDDEPFALRALSRIDQSLAKVEEIALAICMLVLIGVGVYQTVMRNVFHTPSFKTPELIQYSTFFIGLIGAALATQGRRLINMDLLTRLFNVKGKLVLRILTALFTIYICWLFFKGSMLVREAILDEKGELIRPATAWLSMPIAAVLIGVHMTIHMVMDFISLAIGHTPPDLLTAEPRE